MPRVQKTLASLFLILATVAYAGEVLDNAAVIRLVRSGLGSDIVSLKIEQSAARFDLSTDALIALKNAGVPDPVIKAMLMKSDTPPAPAPPPQPVTGVPPCTTLQYFTLGTSGWDWVPASLCVTEAVITVDEQNVPLERVVAHCLAKASLLSFGGSMYRGENQEWWFTDGKDTYKFRGKDDEIKAIADFLVRKHPASKHGSCTDRSIHALFGRQ
jgi:hypothetical protein